MFTRVNAGIDFGTFAIIVFFKARDKATICFANIRAFATRTGKLVNYGASIFTWSFVFA
jgi:hypothetical protein